jgi:hypothetical protein
VYYGRLSGWGTSNPVLTDVFYIMSKTNPDTKQVSNVLIKRGKELHGPDRMYLNPNQIILVEPVGPDSKVAQLITEASKQQWWRGQKVAFSVATLPIAASNTAATRSPTCACHVRGFGRRPE